MAVKLYVTYGCGSRLRNCFSMVEAETFQAAHAKVYEVCGTKYAFTYDEKHFAGQEEKYCLTEVPLQPCSASDNEL